jgi:ferrochelatase
MATSRALMADLGLDQAHTTTAFQSRLGRIPWIRPYADEVIEQLAKQGVKKLLVVEPSFVADCLETLEEIGMRGAEDFRAAGGQELQLVPSLNTREVWVTGLAAIVRRNCAWVK